MGDDKSKLLQTKLRKIANHRSVMITEYQRAQFIEKYVPEDARIHFIGHSIGSYIILNLLEKSSIHKRVTKSYHLFPTMEYLADTPNGIFLERIYKYLLGIIIFLSWIFTILPIAVQSFLIYMYIKITCTQKMHLKTIRNFVDPVVLANIFHMAHDEMLHVQERNDAIIEQNKSKLKFYYGTTDGWVPISYCEKMRKDHSDIDVELCVRNFEHAFVLRTSRQVGSMVASWISQI